MKWISVKERLPTPTTLDEAPSVLITDGKEISIGWYQVDPELDEGDNFFPEEQMWHDMGAVIIHRDISGWPVVTHWMPLPPLPNSGLLQGEDDGFFLPPWNIYDHPEKTEGWIEFQKAMRKDPQYYMS